MGAQPSFTAMKGIEKNLIDAGFKPGQAAVLIKSLAEAAAGSTDGLATKQEIDLMEAKLETAIANQSASLAKVIAEQGAALTKAIADQGAVLNKTISEQGAALNKDVSAQAVAFNKALVDVQKQIGEQTWRLIAAVAGLLAIATAVNKFWP